MRTLVLMLATMSLALTPVVAQAGSHKTIGLHTDPPVLTTGAAAKPMIGYTAPLIHVPAPPPVAGTGGSDPGTPAGEGGYDPGTPEPTDPPYVPTTPPDDGDEDDDRSRP